MEQNQPLFEAQVESLEQLNARKKKVLNAMKIVNDKLNLDPEDHYSINELDGLLECIREIDKQIMLRLN